MVTRTRPISETVEDCVLQHNKKVFSIFTCYCNFPNSNYITCQCVTSLLIITIFSYRFVSEVVNGGWGAWPSKWGPCSVSCGGGYRFKYRKCDSPVPSANGKKCHGQDNKYEICKATTCRKFLLLI